MKVKALSTKKHWQRKFNPFRHGGECCGWMYDPCDLPKRSKLDHIGIEKEIYHDYGAKVRISRY